MSLMIFAAISLELICGHVVGASLRPCQGLLHDSTAPPLDTLNEITLCVNALEDSSLTGFG